MVNKFIVLITSLFALLGVSSLNIQSEAELVSFINENISVMKDAYFDEFGIEWDVSEFRDYKVLYDIDDNGYAYIIRFDKGYLVVGEDLNLVELNTTEVSPIIDYTAKTYLFGNSYYKKVDGGFIPNSVNTPERGSIAGEAVFDEDVYHIYEDIDDETFPNFTVLVSLADDLEDNDGNFGEYSIYTRYQGSTTDCGPQAGINMVYTYDFSGLTNLAKSNNSDDELDSMREEMDWTTEGQSFPLGISFVGTWPGDFMSDLSSYMGDDYYLEETSAYINETPAIGLYYNLNVAGTAHYSLIIGKAQSDAWWIFKNNWDILSTHRENYNHLYGEIGTKKLGYPSYKFVKSSFRQGTYALYERNYPKWYQVWIPYGDVVIK